MPDKDRADRALAKHKKHWISNWSQMGRLNEGSTGICMGMCLDWIRRIFHKRGDFGTAEEPRSHIYRTDDDSPSFFSPRSWLSEKNRFETRFELQRKTQEAMETAQSNENRFTADKLV